MTDDDVARSFGSSSLSDDQKQRVSKIRDEFCHLLKEVDKIILPSMAQGREFSICKTKLEEACMWAIRSVSRE